MCGDGGVTHKELNAALGRQTAVIIATMRRSEDKVEKEIEKVSDRVTHIERRGRTENIFASILSSVLTFFSVIIYENFK
jgi:hypothetical protein